MARARWLARCGLIPRGSDGRDTPGGCPCANGVPVVSSLEGTGVLIGPNGQQLERVVREFADCLGAVDAGGRYRDCLARRVARRELGTRCCSRPGGLAPVAHPEPLVPSTTTTARARSYCSCPSACSATP